MLVFLHLSGNVPAPDVDVAWGGGMTPERWARIRQVLDGALERPPDDRLAWVRQIGGLDDDIIGEVESLLAEIMQDTDRQRVTDTASSAERPAPPAADPSREADGRAPAEASTMPHLFDASVDEFRGTDRFIIRRRLGAGAFGTVYEVFDAEQGRAVALKILRRSDPEFLLGFKREFRHLVDVRHPNLVELYELSSAGPFWFFTMELVQGVDFLRHIAHRRRSSCAADTVACDIRRLRVAGAQLASGIAALHRAGILHCDVKPANVLVSPDGRSRLLDFGLVRQADPHAVQTVIAGTPAYMSPEQAQGRPLGPASDWYSFGVMVYLSLTGVLPPGRDPWAPVAVPPPLPFPSDTPVDLCRLCEALLCPNPADRVTGEAIVDQFGGGEAPAIVATPSVEPPEDLVGRQAHLARLEELLHRTREGQAVVVHLHGPSGAGKSALVKAFCRSCRDASDVLVFSGRCHESEAVPFKALDEIVDALARHLGHLSDAEAEAVVPRDAQFLVRVFPVLGQVAAMTRVRRRAVSVVDAQDLRERAFDSLQDLLLRLADRRALVLAIDDLQWGDLDSAAFLLRLLTGPSPPALMFIASYRRDDVDSSVFLKAWRARLSLARTVVVDELTVEELSTRDALALVERVLPADAREKGWRAEKIVRESGGSPFLIGQLAQYAANESSAVQPSVGLRDLVERRLAALPQEARALLEAIALAGRPLSRTVACAAAGVETGSYAYITHLVRDRLVRVRETEGPKQVEVYHDRLREMIAGTIPDDRRRDRHLSLARAWEREPGIDPAVLAVHFSQGGDRQGASRMSLLAAEHASRALAFDQAAQFYDLTLREGQWTPAQRGALRTKHAEALALAGRGVESARAYLVATDDTPSDQALALKRLAAEQLLRGGHTEEGLALLDGVAAGSGIWLAKRPWQAALSIAWHGLRVVLGGLDVSATGPRELHGGDRTRLDVYWSLAIGLGLVDIIRGWDFWLRHLHLSLQLADRDRAAMAMAANAAALAGWRGPGSYASRALLARARTLSGTADHPNVVGMVGTMETLSALVRGDWREAQQLAQSTEQILRDQCTGVAWERALTASLGRTAALLLGDWAVLRRHAARLTELVDEATQRGDLHTIHFLLNGVHIGHLVSDRPNAERELYREVIASLPPDGFYVPHLMALMSDVDTSLYRGDARAAWTSVDEAWPALSTSLLLRFKHLGILAWHLRARAALALAMSAPNGGSSLADAARAAARLEDTRTSWGRGVGALVRAGIESVHGNTDAARRHLVLAVQTLDVVGMAYLAAAARYRLASLSDGEERAGLLAAAEAWRQAAGVANVTRVVAMLAPGQWPCAPRS